MNGIDLKNLQIKLNEIKTSEVNNENVFDENFYDSLKSFHDFSLTHLSALQSKVESVFKLQDKNYNVKITKTEKTKYKKDITTQLSYIDEIIEIVNSISKKITKFEKISNENLNFINNYISKKTFKIIDIDLSEIEKSYFNNFLSKNKTFLKHLKIAKEIEKSPSIGNYIEYRSFNMYKKIFLEENIKNLFNSLDDIYNFFENKKLVEKLLNTDSVLKKHIEKITKMKSIKIKDFYNDEKLIGYLQELSIQEINDELKEYDSKDVKFE